MPLWQVSWSLCANLSPKLLLFEGDRLPHDVTLFEIGQIANFVLETPWGVSLGRFDSCEVN